jgi:hypothetical protein
MAEPAAVSKINTFGPAPAPTTVEKWSKKIEDNPWTVVGLASGAVLLLVLAGAGCWKWGLCPRQCKKQPKPGPVGAQGKADWASEEAERLQGAARAEGAGGTSPADTPAASPVEAQMLQRRAQRSAASFLALPGAEEALDPANEFGAAARLAHLARPALALGV